MPISLCTLIIVQIVNFPDKLSFFHDIWQNSKIQWFFQDWKTCCNFSRFSRPCGNPDCRFHLQISMWITLWISFVDFMDFIWNPLDSIWKTSRKWRISLESVLTDFRWISCEITRFHWNPPDFMWNLHFARKWGLGLSPNIGILYIMKDQTALLYDDLVINDRCTAM